MTIEDVKDAPGVNIAPPDDVPVRRLDTEQLKALGNSLARLFDTYASDRHQAEQKWLRNLRQYLGIYDPEIESVLGNKKSRAYPRITRVKCISVLSRIMNLMFPGSEKNWKLEASPSPDMSIDDINAAIEMLRAKAEEQQVPAMEDGKMLQFAVTELAQERARMLERYIEDQLAEIGGDQTQDYVSLNRSVLKSGIIYGCGVLRGPFVREERTSSWVYENGIPVPKIATTFKPQYDFLPIWDFYPDMSAKTFAQMDGYFIRMVFSRAQLRQLARRPDFFGDVIKSYLKMNQSGNYKARSYETLLKSMGIRENVTEQKTESGKYEVIVWHGPISGAYLLAAGVPGINEDKVSEDFEAEVWMVDGKVIKADMNQWRKLGLSVQTIHAFVFDEDDTSPVGNGLPAVMRDSQMSICAATRMLLDNASVVCGPNLELNVDLMRPDQDMSAIEANKIWYREGTGQEAQYPAVRPIQIDSRLNELLQIVELFMRFVDQETFVGPATGGDMERKGMGETMRTSTGASMMRSDAALPFKDIVRSFDTFTQSVIYSMVQFNTKFNPDKAPAGDYNVIVRGATSLIAKEVRGIQLDQIASTLTDEEKLHVNERKMIEARFAVRDLDDMLISETDAENRKRANAAVAAEMQEKQKEMMNAEIRKVLSDAYKNIAQGQKNSANADVAVVEAALKLLERGLEDASNEEGGGAAAAG